MMDAQEAWRVLGKDPAVIFGRLASLPRSSRVAAARQDLEDAKKVAKSLMKDLHPDKGNDGKLFVRVNEAIMSIEAHVEDFAKKVEEAELREAERMEKRDVFIKIGF
jgi:hypothetical protein